MAIDLDNQEPIDPEASDYKDMMEDLQGNILKGHGRDYTVQIFLRFTQDQEVAKEWIRTFAEKYITSASRQLKEAELYRSTEIQGDLFANFFLTANGYESLGFSGAQVPSDPKFQAGMKSAQEDLSDPDPRNWEEGYQGDVHAMILMADDIEAFLLREARKVLHEIKEDKIGEILAIEYGKAMRSKDGYAIEHFGFVDGISQPLFSERDVNKQVGGLDQWNPWAPLKLVLTRDPNGQKEDSFGSYLVFRKLEQNVRLYEKKKQEIIKILELNGEDEKRAGALIFGRFEDGTPLTDSRAPGRPLFNNFDYGKDDGSKCPFHAHIRKMNPRGASVPDSYGYSYPVDLEAERARRIVRRGITYGRRNIEPRDHPVIDKMPTGGVGLLFMCFQSDIGNQFEFIQKSLANDAKFPRVGTGLDPVIGQGESQSQTWPREWDKPETADFNFGGVVTMKGGEYFFAPSISFLVNIENISTASMPRTGWPY